MSSHKGLPIVKQLLTNPMFTTQKNVTIKLGKDDSVYLSNLSDLLSDFLKRNFNINLNKDNFENLVLNVYAGFKKKIKPTLPNGGGSRSSSGKKKLRALGMTPRSVKVKQKQFAPQLHKLNATSRRVLEMQLYEGPMAEPGQQAMAPYGPTGMIRRTARTISETCTNMNSYDFKVICIFIVACILIFFGFSSLNETSTEVMGQGIVPITKQLLIDNSLFALPSSIIRLITDRITERSMELFNSAASQISTNVVATCNTNAGVLNTLFTTSTYTTCVSAQTATELARITAEQTYAMTTSLTKTLSGVNSGLNLLFIGLGLLGTSSGYIAVRLGLKTLKSRQTLTIQNFEEVDGGNNKKSKKSKKSNPTKKSKKNNKRKTRKH